MGACAQGRTHLWGVNQAVASHSGSGLEDSVMDEQNIAATKETSRGLMARSGRRKLAVVTILTMMGAAIVDPAILNDVNLTDAAGNGSSAEAVDEFEQVELMLAQIDASNTINAAPSENASLAQTVAPNLTVASNSVQIEAVSTTLTIPARTEPISGTGNAPSKSVPVFVPQNTPVTSVSDPAEPHPVAVEQSPSLPLAGAASAPRPVVVQQPTSSSFRIRLTGNIDPIQ